MEHDGCKGCKHENCSLESKECIGCGQNANDKYVRKTNADRIRAMSDQELAEFLVDVETHGYHDQSVSGSLDMLEWLQSEVEDRMYQCCGNCKYHKKENICDGFVCVNSDSDYCAHWTEDADSCDKWEVKDLV